MKENDDVVIEPNEDESSNRDATDTVKKLKETIKKLESEKEEYLLGWQKSRADFVNLRKKDEEEKKAFAKYATENVLSDLIPVLDSFESAFGNKTSWEKVDQTWRTGVEYIYNQLKSVLAEHGITEIFPAIGSPFDVSSSEAVSHTETTKENEDHTVIEVIKRGYKIGDRVIRPAHVSIAEFKK